MGVEARGVLAGDVAERGEVVVHERAYGLGVLQGVRVRVGDGQVCPDAYGWRRSVLQISVLAGRHPLWLDFVHLLLLSPQDLVLSALRELSRAVIIRPIPDEVLLLPEPEALL